MEIFRAGQAISGISTLYGTQDRFAHNASSQCADNILVRGKLAKRYGINAVTVCRGVYRADGTGVTIVRHTSQFAELGFLERCIGEHNADGGVADKLVFYYLIVCENNILAVHKMLAVRG